MIRGSSSICNHSWRTLLCIGNDPLRKLSSLTALGVLQPNGTLTIDLSNLPMGSGGPSSILDTLCDGEFGVQVSDDTSVDFARLTLYHCPCDSPNPLAVNAEQQDGYVGPTPTSPDPPLAAYLLSCVGPTLMYDDPQPQGCFGETLHFPVQCIASATLRIGVHPQTQPPQVENLLSPELTGECSSGWAWQMPLIQLQTLGHVSPPLAGGVTSVVTLDLARLPRDAMGVTSVMSHLIDGALDVMVQDLTGVDFITLELQHCDCSEGEIVGDLNGDGTVDGADLGILLSAWGTANESSDLNGDGTTDGADLGRLLAQWARSKGH